jgi:ParB family chromosome partitioning protein
MNDQKNNNMKKSLGRGLESLLGPLSENLAPETLSVSHLPVYELRSGKYQPRHYFDDESMTSLVASIQEKGILQPILVRPTAQSITPYEIVAGERRWRAAQKAGLKEVPVVIKDMSDQEALEAALIENIQRHDLSPLEEAEGYRRLLEEFDYTQEELAKSLGKSRSHVANMMRLLSLPPAVQSLLDNKMLTVGHARALINCPKVEEVAQQVVRHNLNVRQTENLVQRLNQEGESTSTPSYYDGEDNPDISLIAERLSDILSLPVQLQMKKNGGKVVIFFQGLSQLEALIIRLSEELENK